MHYSYDFGKRRETPCHDCDEEGYCTMNCSPPVPQNDNPKGLTSTKLIAAGRKASGAVGKKSRWA